MFRNTKEPSSGGKHLCLAKVTYGSMVLVHVNSLSIVAAYTCISCCVCVRVAVRPVHTRRPRGHLDRPTVMLQQ